MPKTVNTKGILVLPTDQKKKPLMSQPGMRFVDLQNLTTPEILPSIFLRSSYMPSTKAKEVGRIVPLALFDYL